MCKQEVWEKQRFLKWKSELQIDGRPLHLRYLLRRAAEKFPRNVALIENDRELTYRELYAKAQNLSFELVSRGVKPGDHVMMLCQNSIEFYLFYFGILQSGAVVIPVNTFLGKTELEHIVSDCRPKLILVSDQLRHLIQDSAQGALVFGPELCEKSSLNFLSEAAETELYDAQSVKQTALMLYTSGTTGLPRGVMLSSQNVMTNVMQVAVRFEWLGCFKERIFAVLPLFHVFAQNGCIWLPILTGSTVIIVQRIERGAIRRGLEKKPTIFLGFPALYGMLCLICNAQLDDVKLFISGADAMPARIRAAFGTIYGRAICSGYGLTETSPAIAVDAGDLTASTESVGRLLPGIDCQIRGGDGFPIESGGVGTLWVRGDNVMIGYYKANEMTEKVIRNGWFDTGDLASLDRNGCLSICGREKDLIIHKGLNIYPQEIEQVLSAHPMVSQVAVVGCPDEAHGQVPVAFVVLKSTMCEARQVLSKFCKERLAMYKVPRSIVCVENLPMSATGKIDKKALGRRLSTV